MFTEKLTKALFFSPEKNSNLNALRALSFLLFSFIIIPAESVHSQVNSSIKQSVPDSVVERRLVELALRGPELQTTLHRSKVFEYQLKAAKNSWVNLLAFNFNYNEQSFQQNAQYQIPRYGVGLTVPLGTILSRTQVKAANEAVAIGKLEEEQVRRKIIAEVLTKYRQYKAQTEMIAMETGMMNDVEAALIEARDKFRKNEITFEAYNAVQRSRNDESAKILNLKLEQEVIKLDIERMIGTSLESVMR